EGRRLADQVGPPRRGGSGLGSGLGEHLGLADVRLEREVRRLVVAICFLALPAAAHEIGTTQVRATFLRNHTYEVEITTAPLALLNKLEVRRGLPRTNDPSRLASFTSDFAEG